MKHNSILIIATIILIRYLKLNEKLTLQAPTTKQTQGHQQTNNGLNGTKPSTKK